MKKSQILDCTLRDGSYVLNFNFSLIDTFLISKVLFESGINYVEIGHGLGLGASKIKKIKNSLYSDNDYIKISNLAKVSKKNKIGSFCFSNHVSYKNFDEAKKSGLNFIRFAFEKNNFTKIKKDINYCKQIGLEVHLNLIKTYKYTKNQFEMIIENINQLNIDYLYIVDSSGGMTGKEVKSYIKSARKKLLKKIKIGFHGHNNLGIANSNCVAALENGAEIVDTSMLGMGRGAGNAITESVAAYLIREKYVKEIDLKKILFFIRNYLLKIFPQKYLIENVLMGKSYFHDSEIEVLKDFSKKNKINYLSALDKISFKKGFNKKKIKKDIFKINNVSKIKDNYFSQKKLIGNEKLLPRKFSNFDDFKKNLVAQSLKLNAKKVITICRGKLRDFKIYNEFGLALGHIVSESRIVDKQIIKKFKDFNIFFDKNLNKENFYNYSEEEIKIKACMDVINLKKYKIIKFVGNFEKDFKYRINQIKTSSVSNKILYILNDNKIPKINKRCDALILSNIKKSDVTNNKINFIKPNYGIVLAGEVKRILQLKSSKESYKRRVKINKNLYIIEKGTFGKEGDIVVDDILNPHNIIGQSNGLGGIKKELIINSSAKKQILDWIYNLSVN